MSREWGVKMNNKGLILSIERASVHDGPGLRTTIFLKGCPLHCLWCHNPESQCFRPELFYVGAKCKYCGSCENICRKSCHKVSNAEHFIDRTECTGCKECVANCPYSALEMKGEEVDVEAILIEVEKDRQYYKATGGGLTLSGGEPLSQYDFVRELLLESKKRGLHNCLETCGHIPTEKLMDIREQVDIFLYDFKESDSERHRRFTGVGNELIRKNLYELNQKGSKIILRCPIIPGLNDRNEHFLEIARIANDLENIIEINIMAYHSFGRSKSKNIGKEYPLEGVETVDIQKANSWVSLIQNNTSVLVKRG
ncbi:MAG: glycyl-radical enzyme activating protein [Anaerocolumna sp.]